ncbi:MAG: hypothetical protein MUF24_12745 [Chitinophagaceae bacterium]|jgi:predicted transposase YdaD|nr:hypothetical protein [Chitinophagaceae bacterium]
MKKLDILWKGIIEDLPVHFILFFFPKAFEVLDLGRGIEFLDKELEELFPEENPDHPRYVDKLLKVYTLDGNEEWILIHIEVQGYADSGFSQRMLTYFYRLLDRYKKPVTALAIFTDSKPDYQPDSYNYHFMGTAITYRYNTYKVAVQDEAALLADSNPFAMVVLTALRAIKAQKATDSDLMDLKIDLFRHLINRQLDKAMMRALANFLKMYMPFAKPETSLTFEKNLQTITTNITTMGVEEQILQMKRTEGKLEGKLEEVSNLITKLGLNDEQAADVAGVSIEFVQQVRANLETGGSNHGRPE